MKKIYMTPEIQVAEASLSYILSGSVPLTEESADVSYGVDAKQEDNFFDE